MISFLYLTYRNTILFVLAFILLVSVALFHEDVVPAVAQKYAKEYGVEYSHIRGNLFFGVEIEDLKYKDFLFASSLKFHYNLLSLLRVTPKVELLEVDNLFIDIAKIPTSNAESNSSFEPHFELVTLHLKDAELLYKKEHYKITLNATKSYYRDKLSIEALQSSVRTPYGDATVEGLVEQNQLKIKSDITPSSSTTQKYLEFLKEPPKHLLCDIDADEKRVSLISSFENISLKKVENLALKELLLTLHYSFVDKKAVANATYNLLYEKYKLRVEQNATYESDGTLTSHIESKILNSPLQLPFKEFTTKLKVAKKRVDVSVENSLLHYKISSSDYKKFTFTGKGELDATQLKELPPLLQKEQLTFKHNGSYSLPDSSLKSSLTADTTSAKCELEILYKKSTPSAFITLYPKENSEIFKKYQLKNFSPLKGAYTKVGEKEYLKIDANLLQLNLVKDNMLLRGEGEIASNKFTIFTNLESDKPLNIALKAEVTSLKKTVGKFDISTDALSKISDISLKVESNIVLKEPLTIDSTLHIPALSLKTDEQTTQLIENIEIKSSLSERKITLHNYSLNYNELSIYSKKSSTILLNDSTIELKEFWIFDNLLVNGNYNQEKKEGNFSLKSKKFHYKHKEGEVEAKLNLDAYLDANTTKVSGDIELLSGKISYMPASNYAISDPDIVVLQDIKRKEESNLIVDVHVTAKKSLLYHYEDIDIYFKPNLNIIKKSHKDLALKGEVEITKGEIKLEDKRFSFERSSLFFDGTTPINPQLNLKLHYMTLDYRDILIAIIHTLEEPIFILSSNPQMSQNDIMSYLLFGESAESMFSERGDGSTTSLLLASGVKELFNANSKIKLDTLNLLTNSDGTLGYEVGSRLNKNMRIIYRNDMVSSFILQYSLGKSTRIDVDVRETGQGVSFIYMKDFK